MCAICLIFTLNFFTFELGVGLGGTEDICAQVLASHVVEYLLLVRCQAFTGMEVVFSQSAVETHIAVIGEGCKVSWRYYSGKSGCLRKLTIKYGHLGA